MLTCVYVVRVQVIVKWQRAEKKWMDGSFLDLDAEVIEAEVDEYWREIYKIQKQFNNKLKKQKVKTGHPAFYQCTEEFCTYLVLSRVTADGAR